MSIRAFKFVNRHSFPPDSDPPAANQIIGFFEVYFFREFYSFFLICQEVEIFLDRAAVVHIKIVNILRWDLFVMGM